jgi:1-aminocyclopropane-1-carboxylate deaminase
MAPLQIQHPPLQRLAHPLLAAEGIELAVLRLDLIHPTVSGNKWYKLKHNIAPLREAGVSRVLSFGGAYSNHLYALAAAGAALGLETIGCVRGEILEPLEPSAALRTAAGHGFDCFNSGAIQALRDLPDELLLSTALETVSLRPEAQEILEGIQQSFGEFALIPEGGGNRMAALGCEEIATYCNWAIFESNAAPESSAKRVVAICCGTATTMAGVVNGFALGGIAAESIPFTQGFSVLRAEGYLRDELCAKLSQGAAGSNWDIDERFDFGGYGKRPRRLRGFVAVSIRRQAFRLSQCIQVRCSTGCGGESRAGNTHGELT